MLIQPGRVCVKKFGRDAGSRAVITAVEKDGFVKIISADRPKERRCNPTHLEFLNETVDTNNKEALYKMLGITEKKPQPKAAAAPSKRK
ncbi:MAG: 50S ribosomal protein L14e [Candidatus Marsarchaeota archaeon]|nr:50S ribosomal protein L14e [Candidatus Marsarchaeota archaeon]